MPSVRLESRLFATCSQYWSILLDRWRPLAPTSTQRSGKSGFPDTIPDECEHMTSVQKWWRIPVAALPNGGMSCNQTTCGFRVRRPADAEGRTPRAAGGCRRARAVRAERNPLRPLYPQQSGKQHAAQPTLAKGGRGRPDDDGFTLVAD